MTDQNQEEFIQNIPEGLEENSEESATDQNQEESIQNIPEGLEENSEESATDYDQNKDEPGNPEEDKRIRAQSLRQASSLGNFGLFLFFAVVFGYVIGRWMDGFFGTKPVFVIFWVVCGIAAAILDFVKSIRKMMKEVEKDES